MDEALPQVGAGPLAARPGAGLITGTLGGGKDAMAKMTIDQIESIPVAFELDRLETRYAQPMSEVQCAGLCACCNPCSDTGCSTCALAEPGL